VGRSHLGDPAACLGPNALSLLFRFNAHGLDPLVTRGPERLDKLFAAHPISP
jgi:hypothetical protein